MPKVRKDKSNHDKMTAEETINCIKDHMDVHRIGEHSHIKLSEELSMAIAAIRECEELENPKPLTLDELRQMAGEPVWCSEYQCYGIIKVETIGRWANTPFLVGVWHNLGAAVNFEYDIKKRGLTIYRNKPKEDI